MQQSCAAKGQFVEAIEELGRIGNSVSAGSDWLDEQRQLLVDVAAAELTIPVIGPFSSGKSTMLNTLMQRRVLPSAVRPETALALELCPGETEKVEVFGESGSTASYSPEQLPEITREADKWVYGRAFLDNQALKELSPVILVDMPGFNSPIKTHLEAILRYLTRGSHYIAMCDMSLGTLPADFLARLREIALAGKKFHVFLSKSDLVPQEQRQAICAYTRELLKESFSFEVPLEVLDNTSAEKVRQAVASLDPDGLFATIWFAPTAAIANRLIDSINLQLAGARKELASLDAALDELRQAAKKLERQGEEEAQAANYGSGGINQIVGEVGRALSAALPELVAEVERGDRAGAEALLNEVTRNAVIPAVQKRLGAINGEICARLETSLEGLGELVAHSDNSWIESVSGKIQEAMPAIQEWLNEKIAQKSGGEAAKSGDAAAKLAGLAGNASFMLGSKTAGGALASGFLGTAANIAAPVLGVVVMFLPEILTLLFGGDKKQAKRELIRSKFEGEIFPAIKSRLRRELPPQIEAGAREMLENVRHQYAAAINEKMTALENAANAQKEDREKLASFQKRLEDARDEVIAVIEKLARR